MSYIDEKIISMRINKSYIKTIKAYVVKQLPLWDCQVCLSRVLTTLDDKNLPYSRAEIRKAFDVGYSKEAHGDKRSYINWLSKNCSRKVVYPDKLKSRLVSLDNKRIALISQTNKALGGEFKGLDDKGVVSDIKVDCGTVRLGVQNGK